MGADHYDILLKRGHVIDPKNGIDGAMDVAIAGERIAAVEHDLDPSLATQVIDLSGRYVTPGLIDIHVHVYHTREPEGISVMADSHSFRSGVTTMVDAGMPGPNIFFTSSARSSIWLRPHLRLYQYCGPGYDGRV